MTKYIKVLSIDGGGMAGIIPLIIIKTIELRMNKPINKIFDFIIGISSGGLAALHYTYLNSEMFSKCLNLFKKVLSFNSIFNLIIYGNMLNSSIFKNFLTQYNNLKLLKPQKNNQINHCCIVTLRNKKCYWEPYFLRNYKIKNKKTNFFPGSSNWSIKKIFKATTAIPILINSKFIHKKNIYWDHAIINSNPSNYIFNEVKSIWPDSKISLILSLGCGMFKKKYNNNNIINKRDIKYWIQIMFNLFTNKNYLNDFDMNYIHLPEYKSRYNPNCKYFRINPSINTFINTNEYDDNIFFQVEQEILKWTIFNQKIFDELSRYL